MPKIKVKRSVSLYYHCEACDFECTLRVTEREPYVEIRHLDHKFVEGEFLPGCGEPVGEVLKELLIDNNNIRKTLDNVYVINKEEA